MSKTVDEMIAEGVDGFESRKHGSRRQPGSDEKRNGKRARTANSNWLHACILNEKHQPLPILANVLIGLRAELPDAFAFDEMSRVAMLMKSLRGENDFKPRPCTDIDVGIVQERLQHLGLARISKEVVHQAVDMRAAEHSFHPIRDYLEALNGTARQRVEELFSDLLRRRAMTRMPAHRRDVPCFDGSAHLRIRVARRTTCRSSKVRRAS